MYRKYDKIYYDWHDYAHDMKEVKALEFNHVVGIYRGSLGMAVHVSNLNNVPMSMIGFQTRDGEDKEPYWIHNLIDENTKTVLVVDDIFDTGHTMKKVVDHISYSSWDCEVISWCLFGKPNEQQVLYSQPHSDLWVVFPWETVSSHTKENSF